MRKEDKKEIDNIIAELKSKGKFKEAEYFEKNRDRISPLWGPQHWIVIFHRRNKVIFWLIIIALILIIVALN